MAGQIREIRAREVFTTKQQPTIEIDVLLEDGVMGRAAAPSGTSRGRHEPRDLVDGDPDYFNSMGVRKAVKTAGEVIGPALKGKNVYDQSEIDRTLIALDGTPDRVRLGGNCIVATSIACAKAAAASKSLQLFEYFGGGNLIPLPFVYMMFGGPAFVGQANTCDYQEYALIPLKARSYVEGYVSTLGIYRKLLRLLEPRGGVHTARYPKISGMPVARFPSNDEALTALTTLIAEEGYRPGEDFGIYIDVAANQLYRDGRYHLQADGLVLSRGEWLDRLAAMCDTYPIVGMEDCLYEDDWEGWQMLTSELGRRVQLVGDDLFVTNAERLKQGIDSGVANAIVIKPNQVGTVTETLETVAIAREAGYGTIVSPRSGELWDPYLVHLCVGQNLGQGKIVGGYASGESNLNELIRIADVLGSKVQQCFKEVLPQYAHGTGRKEA